MANSHRDTNGRFLPGNPGGPGRPPRAVERDFLVTLADEVTLDEWRLVVRRALEDAKEGDARARDWVSRYVLGTRRSLLALAADECTERTPVDDVFEAAVEARVQRAEEFRFRLAIDPTSVERRWAVAEEVEEAMGLAVEPDSDGEEVTDSDVEREAREAVPR